MDIALQSGHRRSPRPHLHQGVQSSPNSACPAKSFMHVCCEPLWALMFQPRSTTGRAREALEYACGSALVPSSCASGGVYALALLLLMAELLLGAAASISFVPRDGDRRKGAGGFLSTACKLKMLLLMCLGPCLQRASSFSMAGLLPTKISYWLSVEGWCQQAMAHYRHADSAGADARSPEGSGVHCCRGKDGGHPWCCAQTEERQEGQ